MQADRRRTIETRLTDNTSRAREQSPDETVLLAVENSAREFVAEAGKIVLERHASLHVEFKGGNKSDPVTEVDRAVEAYMTRSVAEHFPEHAVLGEEGEDPKGSHEWEWIVDPVDGTLNYVSKLPLYAVSIGVLWRRRPVVGVVLLPASGETLHARQGGGAFCNGERLQVRESTKGALIAGLPVGYWTGFKTKKGFRSQLGETRSFGSIAYEMGMAAAGSLDIVAFRGPKIWDVAGATPIISEAGGKVLYYSKRRSAWLPLDRFDPPPRRALRTWNQPVLAGSRGAVDSLAALIEPRYPPALLVAAAQATRAAKRGYLGQRSIR